MRSHSHLVPFVAQILQLIHPHDRPAQLCITRMRLTQDARVEQTAYDHSVLHEPLKSRQSKCIIRYAAVWQEHIGHFGECAISSIQPKHCLWTERPGEPFGNSVRGRI